MTIVRKRQEPFHEQVRFDPFRQVDWRWRRACWHAENGHRFSPRRDDAAIGRAVRFARAWRHCQTRRRFLGLRRRDPALFAAHELYRSSGRLRLEIEARLLTGQGFAEIAARLALPIGVIEAYEATFFAVVDHLAAQDWIASQVLRANRQVETDNIEFASVVKSIAFWHGPLVLDALLQHVVDANGQFTVDRARDWSTDEGRLAARLAIVAMTYTRRANPTLTRELARAGELIGQLEQLHVALSPVNRDLALLDEAFTLPSSRSMGPSRPDNPIEPSAHSLTDCQVREVA